MVGYNFVNQDKGGGFGIFPCTKNARQLNFKKGI